MAQLDPLGPGKLVMLLAANFLYNELPQVAKDDSVSLTCHVKIWLDEVSFLV